ncbi:MAG: glycosyltransferase family 39 protein, partial [Planctomycetes bacterium]|nr:glycosyltransferase family 39 protein [Planctomycetota bacterium]
MEPSEAEIEAPKSSLLERAGGTVLGFVALAAIYLARMQAVAHSDGPKLFASDGHPDAIHFLFAPTLALWRKVCGGLWLSDQYVATALSCVSTAFAVVCLFWATRRFEGRRVALSTALLVAAAPAVFFYATTIEIHATFLAVFGLVALATGEWLTRPTIARGLLVGALCGFGYWMHNTGALLPIVPVSMLIARVGRSATRSTVATVLALVVAHVVVAGAGHLAFVPDNA